MAKTEDLFVAQNETIAVVGICSQSDETTYTTQNLFFVTSDFETGGHYKYKQSLGFTNITKA